MVAMVCFEHERVLQVQRSAASPDLASVDGRPAAVTSSAHTHSTAEQSPHGRRRESGGWSAENEAFAVDDEADDEAERGVPSASSARHRAAPVSRPTCCTRFGNAPPSHERERKEPP